jgi:hypothetical protein
MLGLWLIVSPFIFRHGPDDSGHWTMDLATGFAVMVLSFLSYSKRYGYAHFITLLVGLFLIGFGYAFSHPRPPAAQNEIVIGLLLAMMAIIPNGADLPPEDYRTQP